MFKDLTLKDVREAADMIVEKEENFRPLDKLRWFTRSMNRLGWHRKYEIIIFDKSKFKPPWYLPTKLGD